MAKAREKYLYLTTRGRKSGLPRKIEIWFTSYGESYYVIAEHPSSHWVQNLRTDPRVQVRVGEKTFSARARVVSEENEPELHRSVQQLFREKYGWGDGLVVEIGDTN